MITAPVARRLKQSGSTVRPQKNERLWVTWGVAAAAMFLALALNFVTGVHVDRLGPTLVPARDLLHMYLPVRSTPLVHTWGFVGFLVVLGLGVLRDDPWKRGPLILWAYALIIATRAIFTVLTPLGLPPQAPVFTGFPIRSFFQSFDFRNALFFSGHTAFPMAYAVAHIARRSWRRLQRALPS